MGKYKQKIYKEDSTRGSALMRPRSYKGDSLVQAWIDRRKLAVISVWLDEGGYSTRHLSDLIKFTIDEVANKLVDNGIVRKIEFTSDASRLLESKYTADLNPGGRGERNLLHNLQLDEIRRGVAYRGDTEISRAPIETNEEAKMRAEAEKMADVYRRIESGEITVDSKKRRMEEEGKEAMRKHKESYKYDDNGVVILPKKNIAVKVEERIEDSKVDSIKYSRSKGNSYKPKNRDEIDEEWKRIEEEDKELAKMDMTATNSRVVKLDKKDN